MFYRNFAKMFKGFPKSAGSNLTQKIGNPPKLKSKPVFCMWSDLLGFSNHFTECNWNLSKKQKQRIYARLVAAHSSVLYYSRPDERNLILNDGIAKIYSILEYEKNTLGALGVFLRYCIELHMTISNTEKHDGYPGCRSVISFGEYIEYLADEVRFDDYVYNYSKPQGSEISYIAKIIGNPLVIYNPKELQMNTAFSKAYILEGCGQRIGIKGNNLYIDQSVIDVIAEYAHNQKKEVVWHKLDEEIRFLVPYNARNLNEVFLGFAFDKDPIKVEGQKYNTTVYRLRKLFPYDERIDEFCFDLDNP